MEVQAVREGHFAPDLNTGGGPVGEATENSLPLRDADHGEELQQLLIQWRGSSRAMLRRGSSRILQQVSSMTNHANYLGEENTVELANTASLDTKVN